MTEPNDPNAGTPGPGEATGPADARTPRDIAGPADARGPAEAPTEPVPVAWTDPVAPPPVPPAPPEAATDGQLPNAPPAPSYPPPPVPPTHWETPAASRAATGEGPAPGWVYVGFWRRFAATLIDWVLFFFLYLVLAVAFLTGIDADTWRVILDVDPRTGLPLASDAELVRASGAVIRAWPGVIGVSALVHILYHVILWSSRGGTLGQLALGIQVRRESDGRKIGLGTAFLRYIGYVIASLVIYIGLIWVAFDKRKQGWHDKIASTVVIRRVY